jgi:hypothetical protein
MSAWIESEDGIWEHHKTVKLCGLLGIKLVAAVGHLTSLWHFVLRNAWRDADLSPWGDAGIEMACRWEGEAGKMVKALRECGRDGGPGFLEGSTVHGWLERAGKLVQDRFYNEKRRQDVAQKNTDAVKRRKSDATQPNPTQPNHTKPKTSSPATAGGNHDGFEQWWETYPKKVAKEAARKAWKKLGPRPQMQSMLLNAVKAQCSCDQWTKDDGRFIPNPTTWLNQGRWTDEVKVKAPEAAAPAKTCESEKCPIFTGGVRPKGMTFPKDCDRCEAATRA